jgi:type VI secretion system secreted protein Hcp
MAPRLKKSLRRLGVWVVVAAIYSIPIVGIYGAVDMFLKIDGIDGESLASGHEKWIELNSFSWGVSQAVGDPTGPGGLASTRSAHKDILMTKTLDKSSPLLFLSCCQGKLIPTVSMEVTKPTAQGTNTYLTITLTDVFVSSVQPAGTAAMEGAASSDRPSESVSFNYGKIEYHYKYYDAAGGFEETASFWDRKTNQGQ